MKFTHLRTELIIVSRMVATTGDKIAMSTITSIYVNRQALDLEKSQLAGGVFGKTFVLYADVNADIVAGDKIKDADGNFYKVASVGVTKYDMGNVEFIKVIITRT